MTRALAILAVIALITVGVWVYTRPSAPVAVPSPSPAPTATAATASPTPAGTPSASATPGPTPTGTPIPYGSPAVEGSVTVRGVAASPGPDFRYIVTGQGTGTDYWIVLLDLGAKRAQTVAQVDIVVPAGSQSAPGVGVHATSKGDRLLIVATEPAGQTSIFFLDVVRGAVRSLGKLSDHTHAVLSPDGSRFAFLDRSSDIGRNGVWVGSTVSGSTRRLIADDPQRRSSPPSPQSFSPDGKLLAVGLSFGGLDQGDVIAIIPSDATSTRVDAAARKIPGATILEPGGVVDWRGAPADVWIWQGYTVHLGVNAINSFDLATGRRTLVYAPTGDLTLHHVERHPALDRFATEEGDMAGNGAIWVRTRQGSATKVADTTEAGPHSPWWSPDGSKLYAFRLGDDSVGTVVELLSGEGVVSFCLREATGSWDCV